MVAVYGTGSNSAVATTFHGRELHRNVLIVRRGSNDGQQLEPWRRTHTHTRHRSLFQLSLLTSPYLRYVFLLLPFSSYCLMSQNTFITYILLHMKIKSLSTVCRPTQSHRLTFPALFNFLSNSAVPRLVSIHLTQ
jgi:hypothetical protein